MEEKSKTIPKFNLEIIPAILVKTKEEFLKNIQKVKNYVSEVHIDVMDGKFVSNKTLSIEDIIEEELPEGVKYEFHWMISNPIEQIKKIKGDYLHQIQVETINDNWDEIKKTVSESGGRLCISLNPSTEISKIKRYIPDVQRVLVMFVVPGQSHQKYIERMEDKVKYLRTNYPDLEIEVDGGINFETIKKASKAGADKFVSCSTIFSAENRKDAINLLKKNALGAKV